MVISEKSSDVSPCARGWLRPEEHTLSVHEVGDGDRVVAVDLGDHAVEDSAGMGLARPDSHVLLAKLLELAVDGDGLLQTDESISIRMAPTTTATATAMDNLQAVRRGESSAASSCEALLGQS